MTRPSGPAPSRGEESEQDGAGTTQASVGKHATLGDAFTGWTCPVCSRRVWRLIPNGPAYEPGGAVPHVHPAPSSAPQARAEQEASSSPSPEGEGEEWAPDCPECGALDWRSSRDLSFTYCGNCGYASPAAEAHEGGRGGCYDCGRRYGDEHGFPDLVLPHAVWAKISPAGDASGLLCPSCICKRAHAAGLHEVDVRFMSGPFARGNPMLVGDRWVEQSPALPSAGDAESLVADLIDAVRRATVGEVNRDVAYYGQNDDAERDARQALLSRLRAAERPGPVVSEEDATLVLNLSQAANDWGVTGSAKDLDRTTTAEDALMRRLADLRGALRTIASLRSQNYDSAKQAFSDALTLARAALTPPSSPSPSRGERTESP